MKKTIDIQNLMQEIIDKKVYKEDYENITTALLFEKVKYEEAINALERIIDSGVFGNMNPLEL